MRTKQDSRVGAARAPAATPARPAPPQSRVGQPPRERAATAAPIVDETLAESFPASDPPSWTAGVARLSPDAE